MFTEFVYCSLVSRIKSDSSIPGSKAGQYLFLFEGRSLCRKDRALNVWGSHVTYDACREFTGPKSV